MSTCKIRSREGESLSEAKEGGEYMRSEEGVRSKKCRDAMSCVPTEKIQFCKYAMHGVLIKINMPDPV